MRPRIIPKSPRDVHNIAASTVARRPIVPVNARVAIEPAFQPRRESLYGPSPNDGARHVTYCVE